MQGGNGRAQSWSTFNRRQHTPPTSSSPAPYLNPPITSTRSSSATVTSPKTGPRFRTILHPERHVDRELRQKLLQSRARLQSSFDAIADKYSSVPPEEDDEIDLGTYVISTDNGHLKSLEARPFAEGSDYLGEAIEDDQDGIRLDPLRLQSEPVIGPELVEFGDDEDELGDWGDKSGLDAQYPVVEIENEWTADDLHDLDDFMRAEAARRERYGEQPLPGLERRGVPGSSPLRRLSHLVLGTSPEVEDGVMDELELSKGSRVKSGGRETHFRHPSSTPSPIARHRESGSSPRRRPRVHHSDNPALELSRSTPNLRGAYASSVRRGQLPRELSRTISGLSRSASGHIVQVEEVTTRVVIVQGQVQAPRSRKGKERALPSPPLRERDRQVALPAGRPASRASAHPISSAPSSTRSIQEVTTVRRRETWVSPPSPDRQATEDRRASHRIQYPPSLWTSPTAGQSSSSSSTLTSCPLVSKPNHNSELNTHVLQPRHSRRSVGDLVPNPRFVPVQEDLCDEDVPVANEPETTPSPRRRRHSTSSKPHTKRRPNSALLLASLHLWTVPPEGTLGYSAKLSIQLGKPRTCHACKSASGHRARLAAYCCGRSRPHLCAYYEEGFDTTADVLAVAREFSPLLRKDHSEDHPNYTNELGVGKIRHCRTCLDAGGDRGRFAANCRGRSRRRLCVYYNKEMSPSEARAQPSELMETESIPGSPHTLLPPKDHPGYKQKLAVINDVVRCCRACKVADGQRGALAGYCRGRDRPWHCWYYDASGPTAAAPKTIESGTPHPDPTKPEPASTPIPAPVLTKDHPGYYQELLVVRDVVRCCRACKDAGGDRGAVAGYCRGRSRPRFCPHLGTGDVAEATPGPADTAPEATDATAETADAGLGAADAIPELSALVPPSDHDGYLPNLALSKGTPRCCRSCKSAGGNRAVMAAYCKGRTRPAMCSHLESNGGLSAINVSAAFDEAPVRSVSPALAFDHAASFDDQPLDGGEPAEYVAPPYPAELSPGSSDSDIGTSEGDDYDDDRFSAYESDATDDGADDDRLGDEDEDEDGIAIEEEDQSSPSETDSDVSVLSTGYGDAQLLVDITPGDVANYTLPPDDRRFSDRLVFQDEEGAYDMAICPRCAEAGGVHAERALWCPGRGREESCLSHPGAGRASELQRATASRVNELDDLFTPSPSELTDEPLKPQDEDMDAEIGGYKFGHITLEDATYMENDEARGERTHRLSATPSSKPAQRILTPPTSSVSGSSKSSPLRATNAQGQGRAKPVKAAASVPRASQVERGSMGENAGVIQNASPKEGAGYSMVNPREGPAKVPTLASSVSRASYTLPAPTPAGKSTGLMLPPPLPRPASTSSPASGRSMRQTTPPTAVNTHTNPRAPQTTPRKRFRDPDSDSEPELPATAPRERSASVSWESPSSTPRKKTRMERRGECEASMLEDEGNLEWGLDVDAGVEIARTFPQRQHATANEMAPAEHGSREWGKREKRNA